MQNEPNTPPESEATEPLSAPASGDPLQVVAGAMMQAAVAVREGATDARAKAQQMAPAATRAISRTVYAACYCVSYGVVFPTMLVCSLVPTNNAFGHGLVDGAHAAQDAVRQMQANRTAMKKASQAARQQAEEMYGATAVAPSPA